MAPDPALGLFSPATAAWFDAAFDGPTAAQAGAWAVRVHDVPSTRDALAVWEMTRRHARGSAPEGTR